MCGWVMIRQILCDFRCQPIVTWVTVVGTALSIFLLASIYMVQEVDVVEVSTESRRDRIMYSLYTHFLLENRYYNSASMSRAFAERIYGGLPGVERMSLVGSHVPQKDVNLPGGAVERMAVKNVDAEYWRIYDYEFLEGRQFTEAEVAGDLRRVIITDAAARRLDAEGSLVGREILIRHIPFEVIGVVKSTSPLLNYSYADMFVPYHEKPEDLVGEYQGSTGVVLLLEEGGDASWSVRLYY